MCAAMSWCAARPAKGGLPQAARTPRSPTRRRRREGPRRDRPPPARAPCTPACPARCRLVSASPARLRLDRWCPLSPGSRRARAIESPWRCRSRRRPPRCRESRMLSGLMSRCTTPCACAYSRAPRHVAQDDTAASIGTGPLGRAGARSVSPSTNGMCSTPARPRHPPRSPGRCSAAGAARRGGPRARTARPHAARRARGRAPSPRPSSQPLARRPRTRATSRRRRARARVRTRSPAPTRAARAGRRADSPCRSPSRPPE